METKMEDQKKKIVGTCESCEFYDYDEEWDEYVCMISLDEDEMIYDEYKSVRKQN